MRPQLTMWGVMTALMLMGCATTPPEVPVLASNVEKKTSVAPSETTSEPSEPVRADDRAVQHPVTPSRPAPAPIDPGASHLVEHMARALRADRVAGDDGLTRIGVARIRNQSRCRPDEFQSMLDRLASQLSHAGRGHQLTFTSDEAADVQYHLGGTAYLITAEGFDMWEMFLSLSSTDASTSLWNAPGAVNMLRQQRPSQPQILLGLHW